MIPRRLVRLGFFRANSAAFPIPTINGTHEEKSEFRMQKDEFSIAQSFIIHNS